MSKPINLGTITSVDPRRRVASVVQHGVKPVFSTELVGFAMRSRAIGQRKDFHHGKPNNQEAELQKLRRVRPKNG